MQHTRSTSLTIPDFTPVPRQPRKDGWTPTRQRAFIAHLAATESVTAATSSVGLSVTQAYRLRAAPGAGEFAAAWDAALDCGIAALKALALDRAINGVPVTPIWKGEAGETYMRHDNRLMMSMLRHYDRPLAEGTVGGAGARGVAPQVMPADLPERLFQNAVKQGFTSRRLMHLRQQLTLKMLKFAQAEGLEHAIGVAEDQIERDRRDMEDARETAEKGPEGSREWALKCRNRVVEWWPLQPDELAEANRIRALLGLKQHGGSGL